MTQQRLLRAVDQVGDRVLRLRAWRWRTVCWFGLAILACVLIAARRWLGADLDSNTIIGVLAGGVVLSFLFQALTLRRQPSLETARQIESTHPGLNDALLAAMEQQPEEPGGQLRYLQTRVIDKAVSHSTYSSWEDVKQQRTGTLQICPFSTFRFSVYYKIAVRHKNQTRRGKQSFTFSYLSLTSPWFAKHVKSDREEVYFHDHAIVYPFFGQIDKI